MKHYLLGTAGHVDHGKTSLVRALTGVDTDRLPQEKERGLSIELGFAPLNLCEGVGESIELDLIDVPGHQRFLRQMIAGVGGFDAVMLVVDGTVGVKPQTHEHLQILDLLGTPRGVIVLTKADRSDPETLDLVEWDVREALGGTFLDGAAVFRTSIDDAESLASLKRGLKEVFQGVAPRSNTGIARLPIDRVFSVAGFGLVVTGSLWEGELAVGDVVELFPDGGTARVRGLQGHGKDLAQAGAGQRVAVNLSGVSPARVKRGLTLISPVQALVGAKWVGVRLRWLNPKSHLKSKSIKVTFYHATWHAQAKLRWVPHLLAQDEFFAQIGFPHEVCLRIGDRFVLKDETDEELLGGGVVLGTDTGPLQARQEALWMQRYGSRVESENEAAVLSALKAAGGTLKEIDLCKNLGMSDKDWKGLRAALEASGCIRLAGSEKVWDTQAFIEVEGKVLDLLGRLQQAAQWRTGWRRDELAKLLGLATGRLSALQDVLEDLVAKGKLRCTSLGYCTEAHRPRLMGQADISAKALLARLEESGVTPPDWSDLLEEVVGKDFNLRQMIDTYLLSLGRVERLTERLVMSPRALEHVHERLSELSKGVPFTTSQARQWLGASRKFVIPVLEWMDRKAWTVRTGDHRIVRERKVDL